LLLIRTAPCHARHPLFVIVRHSAPKQSQGQAHESGQYQSIMTKNQT
jgi:hypothetical protein